MPARRVSWHDEEQGKQLPCLAQRPAERGRLAEGLVAVTGGQVHDRAAGAIWASSTMARRMGVHKTPASCPCASHVASACPLIATYSMKQTWWLPWHCHAAKPGPANTVLHVDQAATLLRTKEHCPYVQKWE